MLRTYEGSLVKGHFYPRSRVADIPDDCHVIVTLLDDALRDDDNQISDTVNKDNSQANGHGITVADNNEMRKSWLERLNVAIALALDEELPELQRSQVMREPISLAD